MQTQPANMTTLTSVLEKLKQKRWDNEFIYEEDKGFTLGLGKHYQPEDLKVIKTYRFEGASDPGDMMVVYIILTNDGRTKKEKNSKFLNKPINHGRITNKNDQRYAARQGNSLRAEGT
jgi:hypothetical protein